MTSRQRDAAADESPDVDDGRDRSTRGRGRAKRIAAAALGGALVVLGLRRRSLGGAAAAVVGGWLVYRGVGGRGKPDRADESAAPGQKRSEAGVSDDATTVERSATVGESGDELSEFLREPENVSGVLGHFAEVAPAGENRMRWAVRGPLGLSAAWNVSVVEERPGEVLRWESLDGTPVPNEWSFQFRPAPGDRGTEVTLRLRFDPPGGRLGDAVMGRLGIVPSALAGTALRRLKSLVETGEIPTLERNPSGRGSGDAI